MQPSVFELGSGSIVMYTVGAINIALGIKNKNTMWFNIPVGIWAFMVGIEGMLYDITYFIIEKVAQ